MDSVLLTVLHIGALAQPSALHHTRMSYAGQYYAGSYHGIRTLASLTLDTVQIEDTRGPAVMVTDGGSLTMADSTIRRSTTVSTTPGTGVWTRNGSITISGSTIELTEEPGIYLDNNAGVTGTVNNNPSLNGAYYVGDNPAVTLTNNTFDDWGLTTSRLKPDAAARLTLDNTVNAIGGAVVEVTLGTQTVSGTWSPLAGIHRVLGDVTVEDAVAPTLTLDAGLEARFLSGAIIVIGAGNPGKLVANGTLGNEIVLTDNGAANFGPYWHPDGRHIIFSSNLHNPDGRNFDLYLIDVDSRETRRITRYEGFDGFPMFSHDGRKLVFASNRFGKVKGETNVFIADFTLPEE